MDRREKLIGSVVMMVGCLIFLVVGYFSTKPEAYNADVIFKQESMNKNEKEILVNNSQNSTEATSKEYKTIVVEIKGEVKNPNVYAMKYGSRIYELIEKAGGYTSKADTTSVNGSMKLKDEDCIIVYNKNEIQQSGISKVSNGRSVPSNMGGSEKIDLNRATKEELKTLPGIGDITAQKIIDYREEKGGFSSVEDLKNISRIGEKTLDKFREQIEVR